MHAYRLEVTKELFCDFVMKENKSIVQSTDKARYVCGIWLRLQYTSVDSYVCVCVQVTDQYV